MQIIFYILVAFGASIIGAICGMGGGIIIKPTLDFFKLDTVETISFLSSSTILGMTAYSVIRGMVSGDSKVNIQKSTPLAIGSIIGGVIGKQLFALIQASLPYPDLVGAVQAFTLVIVISCVLVYTIFKAKIKSLHIKNIFLCGLIGLFLGTFSSFIGIGGGQVNLVVLFFFFSMDTKTAAQNSLYIILFSQLARLITTIFTNTVPDFDMEKLILMVISGILGGMLGRKITHKISNRSIDKLFIFVMFIIIVMNIHNTLMFIRI